MDKPHPRQATAALVLALLTIAVFFPGLGGSFLFDDFPNIVSNPRIQAQSLDAESLAKAAGAYEPGAYGRPLATTSFAVDYYIAGGYHAPQFKRTSLLVHVINSLLVLALSFAVLRASGATRPLLPSFALALAWAAHPLQVSSVLYVVQRMETLSVTFVLAALWTYINGRTRQIQGSTGTRWIVASVLLAAIGILSKETALLFPLYALALELTLFGFAAHDPATSRRWRTAYLAGTVAGGLAFAFLVLPTYLDPASYAIRDFGLVERLLTQFRVLPMYLGWILLPLPGQLSFYYDDFAASRGLLDPVTTLLGGFLLTALLAVALALRKRFPLLALGVLWFFSAHFLTSNVVPFELVFEHRNYFAILGVLLAVYDLLRRIPLRDGPGIMRAGVGAVLLGMMALCAIRAATWGDPLLLASEMVRLNPNSARASNDLGEQYMVLAGDSADSPFYAMAEREFERGARLPSASPLTEQALIILAATAGQRPKQEWWDRLDRKLLSGPVGPQEQAAVYGLFQQRRKGLELDDARLARAMGILFERTQMPPAAYVQFGDYALEQLGDEALATRMFIEALNADPTDADYAHRIISALISDGRPEQAMAVMQRAIELGLVENDTGKATTATDSNEDSASGH